MTVIRVKKIGDRQELQAQRVSKKSKPINNKRSQNGSQNYFHIASLIFTKTVMT